MTSRIAVFVLHNRASGWDCKRRKQIIRIVESNLFAIDCNRNCIDDVLDITDGTSLDINGNEMPDECECLADFTNNGSVNVDDLLILLGEWGTPGILADLNADDIVDIEDLLIFIANWGDCE